MKFIALLPAACSLFAFAQVTCALPTAANNTANFSIQASQTTYSLGPGDGLNVILFDVPELSGARTVLPDGTISLPLLGSVRAAGMTIDELSQYLSELFRPYLARSRVSVTLERPRPVTVNIVGEVNRPGPYTFQPVYSLITNSGSVSATPTPTLPTANTSQANASVTSSSNPVVYRVNVSTVLSQAGGLTEQAKVREIVLRHQLPAGNIIQRKLDLWALLQNGDSSQNPVLQDGDSIFVPRAEGREADVSYDTVAQSSLSPDFVEVQVAGEVLRPGAVRVRSGAPLTSALIAAGNMTNLADPTQVELVRLNRDGTVTRKLVNARLEQPTDEKLNPPLRQADMLIVRRSFGGEIVNGMNTVLSPITQIANVLLLFRAIR